MQYSDAYESMDDFLSEQERILEKHSVFSDIIGNNGSLHYAIEQCKAAMNYPGNGLGLLLHGPTGSGKSFLAGKLFDYCKEKHLIKEKGKLVTLNCAEYADNPDLFLTSLFGYTKGAYTGADKESKGLLALADEGMLFLDEIHSLTPECQEKLFLFMDRGIYHMVGDNHAWYRSSVRFVFATTENPDQALLKTLFRRIPILIEIPSLKERPLSEKRNLICRILREEEKKFAYPVQVSEAAYRYLAEYEFRHNIGELKNAIQVGMANANMRANVVGEETINFQISDLPAAMMKSLYALEALGQSYTERLIPLQELCFQKGKENKYDYFYRAVMRQFVRVSKKEIKVETFYSFVYLQLEQYVDFLFFDNECYRSPHEEMIQSVFCQFNQVLNRHYMMKELSNNEIKILTRYVSDLLQKEQMASGDKNDADALIKELYQMLHRENEAMLAAACESCSMISKRFNIAMGRFEEITMFLFFRYFHREKSNSAIPIVIMAHGYSIASGIAELANQFLHQNLFTGIDMPLDVHVDAMADMLKQYINQQKGVHEIIVMVDMGSLEGIQTYVEDYPDLDIGIINNVTTKLALDVGALVLEEASMDSILRQAVQRSRPNYVIMRNRIRPQAIITVCSSGIGVAEKIALLVENSFPKKMDITVLPISADTLECRKNSAIFEKYQVILVVGTLNLQDEELPFISIENIISGKQDDIFRQVFGKRMNEEELKIFTQNMIRNFSMDHLIGYLTILNPEKIVLYVEEILQKLQEELSFELSNNILIGLYVHISCLIERLIIDKHFVYFMNLKAFEKEHQDFIKMTERLFKRVCQAYNVTLPVSEIGYLYNYIYQGRSVEKAVLSVEKVQWMEQIGFHE